MNKHQFNALIRHPGYNFGGGGGGDGYYANQDKLLGVQADAALELLNAGKPYLADAVKRYASESNKINDPGYVDRMAGQANSDAQQAIAQNVDAAKRSLSRYGINPNSGRFASAMGDMAINGASLKSNAVNTARTRAKEYQDKMGLATAKDFYSSLVGQQSDAASQVASAANSYGSIGNSVAQTQANNNAAMGNVVGAGIGIAADNGWFKDGGKVKSKCVKRSMGGTAKGGLFNVGGAQAAQPMRQPQQSASSMLNMGLSAIKQAPKLASSLSSVAPEAAGAMLQATGNGVASVGVEQLGMMAPEIATFGTDAIAGAAGTVAEGAGSALAGAATALPWVAGALAIGKMFDWLKDGGEVHPMNGKPIVHNKDGSVSTERTITVEMDGKHYVIPTLYNGQQLTNKAAVDLMRAGKNKPVGVFNTSHEANAFAVDRSRKLGVYADGGKVDQYDEHFASAGEKYDIDPGILKAMAQAESGGNRNAVSNKGAKGVMQLMPATAKMMGVKDAYDAKQSIHGGAKYLRQMLDRYNGDTAKAVAAYNAGPGNVDRHGGIPRIRETVNYVKAVLPDAEVPALRGVKPRAVSSRMRDVAAGSMSIDTTPSAIPGIDVTRDTNIHAKAKNLPNKVSPMLGDPGYKAEWERVTMKPEGYTIRRGDNLTDLAKRYGTTVKDIMQANPNIKDANRIYAGDSLVIPGYAEGGKVGSIVDHMKESGYGHTFDDRKRVYEALFGEEYKGTAEQNTQFLKVLEDAKKENESDAPEKIQMDEGGKVAGPGTETSDSIDAKLSNNEFVNNADSVKMTHEEVAPVVDAWKEDGGSAEDLLEGINQAGLVKRYGNKETPAFLIEARDFIESLDVLPHSKEAMPVLEEAYYRLNASKPANPDKEETKAIQDVRTAIDKWTQGADGGATVERRSGGGFAHFMDGAMRGFNDGQEMSRRYREAKQQKEFQSAMKSAVESSESEAAQSGKTVNFLDTGDINKNDLDAGGGTNVYSNADHAQSAYQQAKDYESMQNDMDAEYSKAFGSDKIGVTQPAQAATFGLPELNIETTPLPSMDGKPAMDERNSEMLREDLSAVRPKTVAKAEPTQLPDVVMPEAKSVIKPSGIRLTQGATRKATAEDVFATKYVPGLQAMLMKQGRIKEAEAFGNWAQDKQRQNYGNAWSKAAMKYLSGDTEGAISAIGDVYNRMVPDGRIAETQSLGGGKYALTIRNEADGSVIDRKELKAGDMMKMALGALSPMEQFNAWYKMENEKPNVKVVGDMLYDLDSGKVLLDARKDAEVKGYRGELNAAMASGQISADKANALYLDYLTNKAKKTDGVTIQNFPASATWHTSPTGEILSIATSKDRTPSVVGTGAIDDKYIKDSVSDGISALKGVNVPRIATKRINMGNIEALVDAEIRKNINEKTGITPRLAATNVMRHALYQAYLADHADAKGDKGKIERIDAEYRRAGVIQ